MSARARLCSCQAGMMLTELIISMALSLTVLGGVYMLFDGVQDAYVDRMAVLTIQQSGRIAMEQIRRDIHSTGVGLAWVLPPTPLMIPRADGGVDLRENIDGLASSLTGDMSSASADIAVYDVTGLSVGDTIALYDAGGSIEYITVTGIDAGANTIQHSGASKAFLTENGAAVSLINTISLYVADVAGVQTLLRAVDGGTPQPLAEGVVEFTVNYFDNSLPPAAFTPDTIPKQTRIKVIEVTVRMRSPMPGGDPFPEHEVRLSSRVTPRALALS